MRKFRLIIIVTSAVIMFMIISYLVVGSLKPKVAGIYIETTPSSTVWLNGIQAGVTPFRDTLKPGETVVRLVPNSLSQVQISPYETKVRLVSGVETVIRYDFGPTDDYSAGELISFEKSERNETSLVAVTIPDSTEFVIDQGIRAFTPYKTSSITPGDHILRFSAQGYLGREVKVRIHENYKLTVIVKLAKSQVQPEPTLIPIPTATSPLPSDDLGSVEILSTDIGYLRVRSGPSSVNDEVGRVEPGRAYPLVEVDPGSGWYKIEYLSGQEGWISNQYARKVGGDSDAQVPTANPTPVSTSSAATAAPIPSTTP